MKRKRNRKTQKAQDRSAFILSSLICIKANLEALERKTAEAKAEPQA